MESRRAVNVQAVSNGLTHNVAAMTMSARVEETLRRSIPMVPTEAREIVTRLLSPKALKEIATTLVIWASSHFIGVGELADLILLLAGFLMFGQTALDAAKELMMFGLDIVQARVSKDLDTAARHFAKAVVLVGAATVSALLLRRSPTAKVSESADITEQTAITALKETRYDHATKGLDLGVIKNIAVENWQQLGKWPVKVVGLKSGQQVGDMVAVTGYITTEQSVAGASLRELERRMGFESGYLGNSAAIVRLDRVPNPREFECRFYNHIDGGGVKASHPRFPRGPGYPQWEVRKESPIPGRIKQIVSK